MYGHTATVPQPLVPPRGVSITALLPPILIVEDDRDHATILQHVLSRARIVNPTVVMIDGLEAMSYFAARDTSGGTEATMAPVLMLLDLGIPGLGGLEVLTRVRERFGPRELPVVVLTGSNASADIDRAFEAGATAYLVKPVAFRALIDTLDNLGLSRALLPTSTG